MANDNQFQLETLFIVTRDEGEYKEAGKHFAKVKDRVLDVGCKEGGFTTSVAPYCAQAIGIDHTEDAIKMARETYPNMRFELIDGYDISKVQGIGYSHYSIIAINMGQISGYSSLLDTISLLNMYATVFKPRVMIVVNKNLKSFVSRCLPWNTSATGIAAARELQKSKSTKFIGTRGVEEFRASIDVWIEDVDAVLEIGCEWGTTTEIIAAKAKSVIGTDISLKCIEKARQLRPGIRFETLDGFNVIDALKFGINFNKIYIDISGLSGYRSLLDVISLLRTYEMILKPRAIIIKSGSLKHFASHFMAWNPVNVPSGIETTQDSERSSLSERK